MEAGFRHSGQSREDFSYCAGNFVVTGDTEEERSRNAELVRSQIAFYASTRTYQNALETQGWEHVTSELHRKSMRGDWNAMAALITDEMLDEFAVVGTYDEIGRQLRNRYANLPDRISLYQPYPLDMNDPRLARLDDITTSASQRSE